MCCKSVMWIVVAAVLFSGSVSAITDAEAKADFIRVTTSCLKDHPVEMSDVLKLKSLELSDNRDVKCLLACTYRKYGTMNDDGIFDITNMYALSEKTKEGDDVAIANGKKLADVCVKVNDEKVTDGKTGCERAGLMFKCFVDNARKFNFSI